MRNRSLILSDYPAEILTPVDHNSSCKAESDTRARFSVAESASLITDVDRLLEVHLDEGFPLDLLLELLLDSGLLFRLFGQRLLAALFRPLGLLRVLSLLLLLWLLCVLFVIRLLGVFCVILLILCVVLLILGVLLFRLVIRLRLLLRLFIVFRLLGVITLLRLPGVLDGLCVFGNIRHFFADGNKA